MITINLFTATVTIISCLLLMFIGMGVIIHAGMRRLNALHSTIDVYCQTYRNELVNSLVSFKLLMEEVIVKADVHIVSALHQEGVKTRMSLDTFESQFVKLLGTHLELIEETHENTKGKKTTPKPRKRVKK